MLDYNTVQNFIVALLIGGLVGVEREKRKTGKDHTGIGGLRTFIFFSELGAVAAWLTLQFQTPFIFISALFVVALLVSAAHFSEAKSNPDAVGLTTELAALNVYLLGGMVMLDSSELAVCLAIVTAALLAYKQPLHALVGRLGWDDIFIILRLLIASFIVLPLLPDRPIDPWAAINPYRLWLFVVLISSLSLVGYVATRLLGTGKGAALTGVTGGLVSSTAVTLSFAKRSVDETHLAHIEALSCGITLAWAVMFLRILTEILLVNPTLISSIWPPFVVMAGISSLIAFWFYRQSAAKHTHQFDKEDEVPLRNPFSLRSAIKFAIFFAGILFVVKIISHTSPAKGIYLVSALAGLTDVDAITLSMAEYAKRGAVRVAMNAILIASITNTLVKLGIVTVIGSSSLRCRLLFSTFLIIAGGAGTLVFLM